MGFLKNIRERWKGEPAVDDYTLLQKRMEISGRKDRSGFDSASRKIVMGKDLETSPEARKLILIHEGIHKEISGESFINLAYWNLNQIYDVLVSRFLEQFGTAIRSFNRKKGMFSTKLNRYTLQYIENHMGELLDYMSRDRKLVKYCEFCVEFRRRYTALLAHTQLVQEGTAVWRMLNGNYEDSLPEEEREAFCAYIREQRAAYENPDNRGNLYYEGYQIAGQLAKRFGADSLAELAVLALSPPFEILEAALFHASGSEFEHILQGQLNCDEAWKKLADMKLPPGSGAGEDRGEIYRFLYGKDSAPLPESAGEFWREKTVIDAINELEGKKLIGGSIKEYVESEDYVSKKPMPYTQTRKIILDTESEREAQDDIIRYHREHPRSWGSPWEENPDGEFAEEYEENQRIQLENITNMMSDVIRRSKER